MSFNKILDNNSQIVHSLFNEYTGQQKFMLKMSLHNNDSDVNFAADLKNRICFSSPRQIFSLLAA